MQGKYDKQYEQSEEFQQELKVKVRELLTEQEWRRRKMQMRVCSNHHFPNFHVFENAVTSQRIQLEIIYSF